MNLKIILCVFIGLIFLITGHCQKPQMLNGEVIKIKPSEKWWVGIVNQGDKMPVSGIAYAEDFYANSQGNQFSPLLLSSKGRYKAHKDSDYAILIIMKQKVDWKTELEISDLCFEIDLKYNITTDNHIIGEPELLTLRGKQPIFANAIANGLHA